MFRRSVHNRRSAKHTHDFSTQSVGANLSRQVCRACGQVSITSLAPSEPSAGDADPALFNDSPLTVRVDETVEPEPARSGSGERRDPR